MNFLTRLLSRLTNHNEETDMAESKAINYSDEAVARMESVYSEASTDEQRKNAVVLLCNELGKTPASIVSKLVNMGIYQKPAPVAKRKVTGPTKAQIAGNIAEYIGVTNEVVIKGLAKADKRALEALQEFFEPDRPLS